MMFVCESKKALLCYKIDVNWHIMHAFAHIACLYTT